LSWPFFLCHFFDFVSLSSVGGHNREFSDRCVELAVVNYCQCFFMIIIRLFLGMFFRLGTVDEDNLFLRVSSVSKSKSRYRSREEGAIACRRVEQELTLTECFISHQYRSQTPLRERRQTVNLTNHLRIVDNHRVENKITASE
jgi:hypothetical protein